MSTYHCHDSHWWLILAGVVSKFGELREPRMPTMRGFTQQPAWKPSPKWQNGGPLVGWYFSRDYRGTGHFRGLFGDPPSRPPVVSSPTKDEPKRKGEFGFRQVAAEILRQMASHIFFFGLSPRAGLESPFWEPRCPVAPVFPLFGKGSASNSTA